MSDPQSDHGKTRPEYFNIRWELGVAAARKTERIGETAYPRTPDGRYFVVRNRLWRCTNPSLPEEDRVRHVDALMDARRAVGAAKRAEGKGDPEASNRMKRARADVQAAKEALGERGPVWWTDGAEDQGGRHPRNTPYAAWYAALDDAAKATP